MSTKPTPIPAKPLKIASIIVLAFAAVLILFGLNVFQVGIKDAKTAQDLQTSGLAGTVIDARTLVSRVSDGELHALRVELTFMDVGGCRIIQTGLGVACMVDWRHCSIERQSVVPFSVL